MPHILNQRSTRTFSYENREVVIEIEGLNKSFGENHVLKNISMKLFEGENLVVLGRSGTGKSVLIKCIVGLMKSDSGILRVMGRDVTSMNSFAINDLRKRIGFSFQMSALYDSMNVRENLEFPLKRNEPGLNQAEINDRVEEALSNVGLLYAIDLMPVELSGGMQKRVGIARTLILNPTIMLYDEPTAGLDPITAGEINELILSVQETYHTSSIIITHDITCARMTSNRINFMYEGEFVLRGTYNDLSEAEDPRIRPFFEY
ncbi:MAG: ATP-binding cassette domain-containing protein [Bacteroidia bacterium]|nr:ATP-binding cassette domain-containing protein [Bacteroidia bacterium]